VLAGRPCGLRSLPRRAGGFPVLPVAARSLTQRTQVSTLEQSPARRRYGRDPGDCSSFRKVPDDAPVTSETQSLPTASVSTRVLRSAG
jgi:hypothetical protein